MVLWLLISSVVVGAIVLLWIARYFALKRLNVLVHHECPSCGYPKRGLMTDSCPECGSQWGQQAEIELPSLLLWLWTPVKLILMFLVIPGIMIMMVLRLLTNL